MEGKNRGIGFYFCKIIISGMKKILVLGAGRSSSVMIEYLLQQAAEWDCSVTVGDQDLPLAESKVANSARGHAIRLDGLNEQQRRETLAEHDLVISLLPPHLHILIAKDCVALKKHLITASYVSPEIEKLNDEVKKAGLLFMCEMGLDPGIDHMSAMELIHRLQSGGATIESFRSGTGGLVAPESDDNPWHYKVTWNPRNLVLAGQGVAQYIEHGVWKYVPYHRLFSSVEKFKIAGLGKFESYPNRDSLQYITRYGLTGIPTLIRSTIRRNGYCQAWNVLVQLGLTDDSYAIQPSGPLTYSQWVASYLPPAKKKNTGAVKVQLAEFCGIKQKKKLLNQLEWLGLFSDEKIPLASATPAQILQELIERKWQMQPQDNDLVVMRHEIGCRLPVDGASIPSEKEKKSNRRRHTSTMVIKGENSIHTAMAKTVGLPLALMAKLIIQQEVFLTGVHLPVMSQVYGPVLRDLQTLGVKFDEEITAL
jgi:saccharopine dehydrogenase (NADP+, L-glutamate forming)